MNTPPFLLGAALLFWGWQAGLLWLGVLLAVAIESARFFRARWEFAQGDLDRIWNLCVLLFFGAVVVAFVSNDGTDTVNELLKNNSMARRSEALNKSARSVILVFLWMPVIFLPMAIAQAFSQRARLDWSTFSLWLRRQRKSDRLRNSRSEKAKSSNPAMAPTESDSRRPGLNVGWPYFAVILLAASAANERTFQFSIGMTLLVGWALWTGRPRRFPAVAWLGCLLLAVALGFAAQVGLRELQRLVQHLDNALISRLARGGSAHPKESKTMLGGIGRLKLSGSVVLRVEADGVPPALLREASYNLFKSPYWAAPKEELYSFNSETDLTTWKLLPNKPATNRVTVAGYLSGGHGLLAVPHGVASLEDLPADSLETNRMGTLHVGKGPGFVRFRAGYGEGVSIDSPPDRNDREVPLLERPGVSRVARELKLDALAPEPALQRVSKFFADNFQYSTWLGEGRRSRSNETALSKFLLQTRAGHCEYFATATVLLLRAAGIPARYAVGYSVQEKKGDQWIVRERHAHAWCLAWVNGAWREVDNTPASWTQIEAGRASWWETVTDAWSRVWFEFSKWRWGKGEWKRYVVWLVVPLLGLAGWRLMSQKQWTRARRRATAVWGSGTRLGLDSEFYLAERRLRELGLERRADETLSAWLRRIGETEPSHSATLQPLLTLHYRLRFDPAGLSVDERSRLKSEIAAWLK